MLVVEALQWANDKLKEEKVGDSPMLDAQVLLASVLGVSKSWLFTHLDHELRPHEEEAFLKSVRRRTSAEPIAYIVGSKEFYKRPFAVNRFVLIPRPATEILVDAAAECARASNLDTTVLADVGTGSGAIAVTLAAETGLPVIASDVSKEAVAIAKQNATTHGVDDRVDIRQGNLVDPLIDIFTQMEKSGAGNAINHLILCANLPYLTQDQWEATRPEVKDHEPELALVGGQDGLEAYWNVCRELRRHRRHLPERVTVLFEIDPDQSGRAVSMLTHDFPSSSPRVLKDLEGFDRIVIAEI